MEACKAPADVRLDIERLHLEECTSSLPATGAQQQGWREPNLSPRSPKPTSLLALRNGWRSLSASSRTLLLLGVAQALTAATFAVIQFAQDWQLLLQDTALILCSAALTLGLLLDAFARENAFQLLSCLALGTLNASQLVVYLATLHGQGVSGAAAAVAICLALQLGAAAVARPAYLGFGWRMYSRIASNWRLKPAEQQRQRAAALARQRFAALARTDGLLLTLMLLVAAVNAANPGGSASAGQPRPLGVLVGAAVAAALACGAWLAACWVAVAQGKRQLATALDFAYPLCHVPPLLVIFEGATQGGSLSQPHAQAYLVLYPLLFLAARTASWWAARQCSAARQLSTATDEVHGEVSAAQQQQPLLPPELLPLARGAWLFKLPSSSGTGGSGMCKAGACSLERTQSASSARTSSSGGTVHSTAGSSTRRSLARWLQGLFDGTAGSCQEADHGTARSRQAAGRQRFFQLSHDGATLRWDWGKWVLLPHIQGISCCDDTRTISLALLLEPDLRLRFACPQQYHEWRQGLQLLLALLVQPGDLLAPAGSSTSPAGTTHGTAAAASEGASLPLGNSSGGGLAGTRGGGSQEQAMHSRERRQSAGSRAEEVVVQVAPSPRAAGSGGSAAAAAADGAMPLYQNNPLGSQEGWLALAGSSLACTVSGVTAREECLSGGQKQRVCARSDSKQLLEAAALRSQAAIAAVVRRQIEVDGKQERLALSAAGLASGGQQRGTATIQLLASCSAMAELALKTSSSEGAIELHQRAAKQRRQQQQQQQQQVHASPRGGSNAGAGTRLARLKSTARRAFTLPAQLLRYSGTGRSGATSPRPAAGTARGSPSKQPLTDALHPSSSTDDLAADDLAAQQAQQQQQQQQQQQDATFASQQPLHGPRHERKVTLSLWAEQPVPLIDLQQQGAQQPTAALQQDTQQQEGGFSAFSRQHGTAEHLSGAQDTAYDTAGTVGFPTIRYLPGGSFIHLAAFAAGRAAPERQTPSPMAGLPPASLDGWPSLAGSEASTPHNRGSPSRQQQLRSFQVYLQQQLAQQQRGRYGPSQAGSSGTASAETSPQQGSPVKQRQADSSLTANLAKGLPPGSARESRRQQTVLVAGAATATPVQHRLSVATGVAPGMQHQQETTVACLQAATLQMQQQQQPHFQQPASAFQQWAAGGRHLPPFDQPPSSADGGAVPPLSSLMVGRAASASQLSRAESTFSSWGLPTPTTATAKSPFGLSRGDSLLLPSAAATPQATFKQHPSFATSHHQQQAAAAALLAAAAAREAAQQRQQQQEGSEAPGGRSPAAGDRRISREWQMAAEVESEGGSLAGTSSDVYPPAAPLMTGLGIKVPLETVDFQDLVFGKFLGEGSEGSVYAAWYRETPVAVKKTRSLVEIEMNLHAGAHDNIVGLRGLASHGTDLYLVMELCPRGTLDVLIHKGHGSSSHRLDPLKLLPIVRSIARGMLHLHTRRPAILHRDLKPGNCFIGHGGVVKVGDLGMSRYVHWRGDAGDAALERTLTPGVIGTAAYAAPELLNPETPDPAEARQPSPEDEERMLKADVYAFGVTVFEIMERRRPFAGMDGFQIQTQWYLDPASMRLPRPTIPDGIAPQARQIMEALACLVESCTEFDPDRRPTFRDILATLRAAAGGGDTTAPPTPAASVANPF